MMMEGFEPKLKEQQVDAAWEMYASDTERINAVQVDYCIQIDKGGIRLSLESDAEQLRLVVAVMTYLLNERYTALQMEMARDVLAAELVRVEGR